MIVVSVKCKQIMRVAMMKYLWVTLARKKQGQMRMLLMNQCNLTLEKTMLKLKPYLKTEDLREFNERAMRDDDYHSPESSNNESENEFMDFNEEVDFKYHALDKGMLGEVLAICM